jgi:hypothetical protein
MIVGCGFGRGVGVLRMEEKPIPFELMLQADRSEKIKIRFIQRSGFILHLLEPCEGCFEDQHTLMGNLRKVFE